ncbi:MAG: DUF3536 domain-containing protein [Pyrinomonadaceae bacterium]
MTTALIIHGHFYQPPRENPWTDTIERQPSARPFDNWNERIHSECYLPNAFARVIDNYGRLERVVNNYGNISFNFGPTLLTWLASRHPDTYRRVIEADRASVRARAGHGNAIAQGYHHAILTLCNERDRRTEIRWGLADFRYRFGREAESLWLPETAANDATLDALIEEGLKYVILSPFQAERIRAVGAEVWQSVSDGQIDTSVPYKYFHRDGGGRSLAVFFYDGHVAKGIAFDGVLASSHMLMERIERAAAGARGGAASAAVERVINVATDGESYGHHFHFGDRCLAYALEEEAARRGFRVTNYGEYLAKHPPLVEVEIKRGPDDEGTAWSCVHGVGRWSRDCSCHAGAPEGWGQQWRAPLRAALNYLRDEAARVFETVGGDLFRDPWRARDEYIKLLVDEAADRDEFLLRQSGRRLPRPGQVQALTLLEMQRASLMTFTSCGWFFNDLSGIETVQVLKYAGRVLDLMDELRIEPPLAQFVDLLSLARSNLKQQGTGADIFRRAIGQSRVTTSHVAASVAITGLVEQSEPAGEMAGHRYERADFRKQQHGRLTLATGRIALENLATGARPEFAVASMHFGDVDFYCVLREFKDQKTFTASTEKLWDQFRAASLPTMLRLMQEEFGPADYGLEHLLPEGRQRIYEIVFGQMVERFSEQYEYLYEESRRNIEMLHQAGFELPQELRAAAEFTMSRRFEEELRRHEAGQDPASYREALMIANEVKRLGYRIDKPSVRRRFEAMVTNAVRHALNSRRAEDSQAAIGLVTLANTLGLDARFERAQEEVYHVVLGGRADLDDVRELALALGLSPSLLQSPAVVPVIVDGVSEDAPASAVK